MAVSTKYACTSDQDIVTSTLSQFHLSAILLIGSLCVVIIYCTIGWLMNGYRKGGRYKMQDFNDNVPHKQFWMKFPVYVWTGCAITKEYMIIAMEKLRLKRHKPVHADYENLLDDSDSNVL